MDKRMRTNLLLVAVLAALGAVIWFAPDPAEENRVALFDEAATFSRIEVRERDETRFVLEKRDERWYLVKPFALDADTFQIDSLIAGLMQAAERRYPVAEANLAELGLQDPRWVVQVDDAKLAIGDRAALGNNRYIRKGDHVYLVSDVLHYRLQREPLDYASKKLLPADADVTAIELPAGERIEKIAGAWKLVPENEAVSADAVQSLADAWRNATAIGIRRADEAGDGGNAREEGGEKAVVERANGERIEFTAAVGDNGFSLTRSEPPLRYDIIRDDARRLLQLEVASQTTDVEKVSSGPSDESGDGEN